MMALRPLRASHLWPLPRTSESVRRESEIDENPFPYFVSDPSPACETVSIGSLGTQSNHARRNKSHSLLHRKTTTPFLGLSLPLTKLKHWIEKVEARCLFREKKSTPEVKPVPPAPNPSPEIPMLTEIVVISSPPVRGRKEIRVGSSNRSSSRGRNGFRRNRSWRPPSQEIWTVDEETDDVGLGITT